MAKKRRDEQEEDLEHHSHHEHNNENDDSNEDVRRRPQLILDLTDQPKRGCVDGHSKFGVDNNGENQFELNSHRGSIHSIQMQGSPTGSTSTESKSTREDPRKRVCLSSQNWSTLSTQNRVLHSY